MQISYTELANLRAVLKEFEENRSDYHYNLLGLITAWAKIPWNRHYAFFCSEFVSTVLIESEILNENLVPSITSPHDILENLNLELIFEGTMWQYKLLDLPSGYIQRFKNYVYTRIN